MGEKYAECQKPQKHLNGRPDGCQHFFNIYGMPDCSGCGCNVSFHRRVEAPPQYRQVVVYTKCNKIHAFGSQASVDGCMEFTPKGKKKSLICALCGCHKAFHRNEITIQIPSPPSAF